MRLSWPPSPKANIKEAPAHHHRHQAEGVEAEYLPEQVEHNPHNWTSLSWAKARGKRDRYKRMSFPRTSATPNKQTRKFKNKHPYENS